jgi:hypothetical protein
MRVIKSEETPGILKVLLTLNSIKREELVINCRLSTLYSERPPLSTQNSATAFGLFPPFSVGGLSWSPLAKELFA